MTGPGSSLPVRPHAPIGSAAWSRPETHTTTGPRCRGSAVQPALRGSPLEWRRQEHSGEGTESSHRLFHHDDAKDHRSRTQDMADGTFGGWRPRGLCRNRSPSPSRTRDRQRRCSRSVCHGDDLQLAGATRCRYRRGTRARPRTSGSAGARPGLRSSRSCLRPSGRRAGEAGQFVCVKLPF